MGKQEINTYKIFEWLLLWSFPLIADVHVPEGGNSCNFYTSVERVPVSVWEPIHLLVKVSEEVDSECVLFVKFVAICILNCLQSLGGSGVL